MSSINNQNMLSPVPASSVEIATNSVYAPALYESVSAFSYDWFVLSDNSISTSPIPNAKISNADTIKRADVSRMSGSSMESRVERIIQFILPQA